MASKFKSNSKLIDRLDKQVSTEQMKAASKVPEYNAKNVQGFNAYSIDDKLQLLSKLNTLKLEPQYYKTEETQIKEIQELIEKIASNDPLWVCKAIIYSRCIGEGMRSVNHLAAALISPFIQGEDYAKRFYGSFNKKLGKGGCIYRIDDMSEIQAVYKVLHGGTDVKGNGKSLSDAMKKAFAKNIESSDLYSLAKYKKTTIDISRLSHPNPNKAKAKVTIDGTEYAVFDAIIKGLSVSAETHESMQSEAGQIIAEAVRKGKISETQAEEMKREAKADNWRELLDEGKLGILAAVRNLHNILLTKDSDIVDKVCKLISNEQLLIKGKVMPYQLDLAWQTISDDYAVNSGSDFRKVIEALELGIERSVMNLKELLPGKNLIMYDISGSMGSSLRIDRDHSSRAATYASKSGLIAAMLAKSVNADIIQFGDHACRVSYNPKDSLFTIAKNLTRHSDGWTNMSQAFDLITRDKSKYDRIFILSDMECNYGNNKTAYKSYIRNIADPYIYLVDLASYGTKPIDSDKVHYLFGYGYAMFDMIKQVEFNPEAVLDLIDKVEF